MAKTKQKWTTISDDRVRHVWADSEGKEHYINPTFYADSGTPIDADDGDDMTYVRTEILDETDHE